ALSDQVPSFGLEHHQCSDNRMAELTLVTPSLRQAGGMLLPHQFVHSWHGKFRRPADMIVPRYQPPQRARLPLGHGGLTHYLAARSALFPRGRTSDSYGPQAGGMGMSRGRAGGQLEAAAVTNFIIPPAPQGWTSYRRSLDYYDEGTLIWLEADVIIRQKTKGA